MTSVDGIDRLQPPKIGCVTPDYPRGYGFCSCGCGQMTSISRYTIVADGIRAGWHRRFINHHNTKGRYHPSYNHGLTFNRCLGRWILCCADGTSVTFARAVAECYLLKRKLRANEVVHHINEDPTDDRPENLCVMTRGAHARLHSKHSRQDVLAKIRRFIVRHKRVPTARECRNANGLPGYTTVVRRFGSLSSALKMIKQFDQSPDAASGNEETA